MKKFLLGTLGLVAMAAPAVAADLPARTYKAPPMVAPLIYDWTGFYIGANGGYGWSNRCIDITAVNGIGNAAFAEGCRSAGGGVFGGQIGYRWQAGQWVFGLEAQGDWANLRNSRDSLRFRGKPGRATSMDWVSSRVRLATPGMQVCFISRAALRSPTRGMIFSRRLVALELRRQNGQVGVARSVLVGNTASRRIGPPASNTTISSGPTIPTRS